MIITIELKVPKSAIKAMEKAGIPERNMGIAYQEFLSDTIGDNSHQAGDLFREWLECDDTIEIFSTLEDEGPEYDSAGFSKEDR